MTIQSTSPTQVQREKAIFQQIGIDIRALRQRIQQVEACCAGGNPAVINTSQVNQLGEIALESPTPQILESLTAIDQGFTDLKLGMVAFSQFDLLFSDDLITESTLETAIIISLYTDARHEGQRGWWGDDYREDNTPKIAESLLWTLLGQPTTDENVRLGKEYAEDALQWLIDFNYLKSFTVHTEHQKRNLDTLAIEVNTVDKQDRKQQFLF